MPVTKLAGGPDVDNGNRGAPRALEAPGRDGRDSLERRPAGSLLDYVGREKPRHSVQSDPRQLANDLPGLAVLGNQVEIAIIREERSGPAGECPVPGKIDRARHPAPAIRLDATGVDDYPAGNRGRKPVGSAGGPGRTSG